METITIFYDKDILETTKLLGVDSSQGLSDETVRKRLEEFGENRLEGKKEKSIIKLFFEQFKDFLVLILIIAAIVSISMHEVFDGIVILAIVILNSILGVYQENKASNALKALKQMASPKTKVVRGGVVLEVQTEEIVPGDIVQLDAGDYVPADVRLVESTNLKIDESALTGESVPVEKDAKLVLTPDASLGDRRNCAYMSSVVTYGRGKAVVTGTGMKTQMGQIAKMLDEAEEGVTPLQSKLNSLGKTLGIVCLLVCAAIFGLGVYQKLDMLTIFMTAISLAVAAVPEGLTVVVTVILALGMQKMVRSNAIIKKLSACETLGSTTVICSDKTGTLTQNKMTVVKLFTTDGIFDVTGTGYDPSGEVKSKDGESELSKNVEKLLEGATLCNDATYTAESQKMIGDPTEGALLVVSRKINLTKEALEAKFPRISEVPFDSDRKLMSTVHVQDGKTIMFTKGAPDEVLRRATLVYKNGELTPITDAEKENFKAINNEFASSALRVLAVSMRILNNTENLEHSEQELAIIGLLGMIDPPREEAKSAIATCKKAGIQVKMITGDHKITASAIGKQLGILSENAGASAEIFAIEGREIDALSDAELREKVKTTNVFARVSPEHKVRLVTALKDNGEIVAMTGDGVNDAPSLKKADIGIAMGITGTDVSKEAADMILTDDNFASIVLAVEEGRTIFNNIRKVVSFLLSCNVGEILVIFLAMVVGLPVPLMAIQLLTINLVTDAFPAFALGMEEKERGIMDIAPRDPKAPIIDRDMSIVIGFQSAFLAAGSLGAFVVGLQYFPPFAITMCFVTLVFGELFRTYSARFEKDFMFGNNIFGNKNLNATVLFSIVFLLVIVYVPFLNTVFITKPLDLTQMGICVGFAILPTIGGELAKLFNMKKHHVATN